MNMQENNEFPGNGKKTPYKVLDGFFETISEKTLLKAKQREQSRSKRLVIWRTMAVAASLAAIVFIGYNISNPELKPQSTLIVLDDQPVEQQVIKNQEAAKEPKVTEIKKVVTEKVPENIIADETNAEEISDVLADLSDEELLQLAAMFKTDPFISESVQ